jgi:hypothetical protein
MHSCGTKALDTTRAAARTVYAMALDLFRRKLSEGGLSQIQGATETRH